MSSDEIERKLTKEQLNAGVLINIGELIVTNKTLESRVVELLDSNTKLVLENRRLRQINQQCNYPEEAVVYKITTIDPNRAGVIEEDLLNLFPENTSFSIDTAGLQELLIRNKKFLDVSYVSREVNFSDSFIFKHPEKVIVVYEGSREAAYLAKILNFGNKELGTGLINPFTGNILSFKNGSVFRFRQTDKTYYRYATVKHDLLTDLEDWFYAGWEQWIDSFLTEKDQSRTAIFSLIQVWSTKTRNWIYLNELAESFDFSNTDDDVLVSKGVLW